MTASTIGRVLGTDEFNALIPLLVDRGFRVIAPVAVDGTIVLDDVTDTRQLPIGWGDDQEAGTYGIHRRVDDAYFAYTVGPRSMKSFLFPPQQVLLTVDHAEGGLVFRSSPLPETPLAFVGVRPCELAAAAVQDVVFLDGPFADPAYETRRASAFTVAVNCAVAGATCFCTSMGTGPSATDGYDLAVTEVLDGAHHEFVVESGSDAGAEILSQLGGRAISDEDRTRVEAIVADTEAHMGRRMLEDRTKALLDGRDDDAMWASIAQRCLACANCTLVCPTCFCSTVEDATDLTGSASRTRRWDSCFSLEFSNLHGTPVRESTSSRYRQWMTHKLASWYDQFGSSGCVGCGRCITWCPVGIDITAEIADLMTEAEVVA
jgi:sulfhydrogenase subunit beta (sulfur reductase)